MASAGEIIAILGLFERVVLELRNYRDAPTHFQQLRAELELLGSTLRHALQLRPSNDDERQTLDKVGAIAMHCLMPLQAMVDKMRMKDGSLGHFRTTRSLASVGTRLHWSMISRKDVDELRKTVLSEMLAINMLLSAQQLGQIKRLSAEATEAGNYQSALIEKHSNALMRQTASIFTIVAATPKAIADLQSVTVMQAARQSKETQALRSGLEAVTRHMEMLSITTKKTWTVAQRHADSMGRAVKRLAALMSDIRELFVFLATCSKEMLEAIGRNTRLLLHIASQMKRVVQVIEAMPRHLNVDIIRLDDALGETWGLPLQGCSTWDSFCNMLQHVVFAGRPGLNRITNGQFAITLATTGQWLDPHNWSDNIGKDIHIEQAMVIARVVPGAISDAKDCPFPECAGRISPGGDRGRACSICGRQSSTRREAPSVISFSKYEPPPPLRPGGIESTRRRLELPLIQLAEELQHFRRVQISESTKPIRDLGEALDRLTVDNTDAAANAFVGLKSYLAWEVGPARDTDSLNLAEAKARFQTAVDSDPSTAEHWYLLARAYLALKKYPKGYECLQQSVYHKGRVPQFWTTIGILYYQINQYRDSLDAFARSVRLNPSIIENWCNLGILYDNCNNQSWDAIDAFEKSLEMSLDMGQDLPSVQARLQVLKKHVGESTGKPPNDCKIYEMMDTRLELAINETSEAKGSDVVIKPLVESRESGLKMLFGADGTAAEIAYHTTGYEAEWVEWETTGDKEAR